MLNFVELIFLGSYAYVVQNLGDLELCRNFGTINGKTTPLTTVFELKDGK